MTDAEKAELKDVIDAKPEPKAPSFTAKPMQFVKAWTLPDLLIRITDDRHAEHPSVQSVVLAIRLARHTAESWDNPAIPDDIAELATLLNLSLAATMRFVRELDN